MSLLEQCTMLNFCFRLFLKSYSFYLFVKFAEVLILKGKADAYKKLICIVERVHFHVRVGVKNLKNIFSHLLGWDAARVFANAIKLLTSFVFLQQSEILYWENKLYKEFLNSNNNVGQRKRCLPIFPAELSLPYFPSRHESTMFL